MPTRTPPARARRTSAVVAAAVPPLPPPVPGDAVATATPAPRSAKPVKPGKAAKVAPAAKRPKPPKPPKPAKPHPKLIRDSFAMPASDFGLIELMKVRALGARRAAKKSELLRAGLRALAALDAKSLVEALNRLEPVKTGRPKKAR